MSNLDLNVAADWSHLPRGSRVSLVLLQEVSRKLLARIATVLMLNWRLLGAGAAQAEVYPSATILK